MIFTSLTHSSTQQARITNLNGDFHPESNDREPLTINSVRVFAGRWKTQASGKLQNRLNGIQIAVGKKLKLIPERKQEQLIFHKDCGRKMSSSFSVAVLFNTNLFIVAAQLKNAAKDTVGLNHDKLTFMTGKIILELKYREDDGKKKL